MNHKHCIKRIGSVVVACLLYSSFSVSGQNTIKVNVGSANQTINRELYGTLMEHWGRVIVGGVYVGVNSNIPHVKGVRKDIIEGFKEMGLSCIEFPGGCFADKYRWKSGITGTQAEREAKDKINGMGTNEFFMLCSLVNAVPYITANVQLAMPLNSTEINEWLTYIHDRPNYWSMVKHWKTGNEEWGSCGNMTQAAYQSKWSEIYNAMPSWAKTNVIHVMDGGSGGGWINADAKFLAGISNPTGISYHRYTVVDWNNMGPSSGFTVAQYYKQIESASKIEGDIKNFSNQMDQVDPNNKIALCMDEWGAWYDAVPGMGQSFNWSTVRDAVIAGLNLNIFNNNCRRVKMALVAQPVNSIQSLMLTETGGQNRMKKTPVFWVFKMLKPHQGAKMAPTEVTCPKNQNIPVLNASSSVDSNNVLHISIVNTHDNAAQDVTIDITGGTYNTISGEIVNGASVTSGTTSFDATDTVTLKAFTGATLSSSKITAKIPAHSVVMLTVAKEVAIKMPGAVSHSGPIFLSAKDQGKILVSYSTMQNTPIHISLYSIDGRTVIDSYIGNLVPGSNSFVWQPKTSNGLYIVKLEAGKVSMKQQIVFAQ